MAQTNFLYSPSITLLVGLGENQKTFMVHESLLVKRSQNIANAHQPDRWQEGADRVISFTEEDPRIFAEYLRFVYRPESTEDYAAAVPEDTFYDAYVVLCGVYILSDMLMDVSMKLLVRRQFNKLSERRFLERSSQYALAKAMRIKAPPVGSIRTIYEGTMEGYPIRAMIVSSFTRYGDDMFGDNIIKTSSDDLPRAFMHELMASLLTKRSPTNKCYTEFSRHEPNSSDERTEFEIFD